MIIAVTEHSYYDLSDFEAWGGAFSRLNDMIEHPKAFDYINDVICDWAKYRADIQQPVTDTEINDFLWFDSDECLREAGLYNPETGLFYDEEGFDGEDEEEDE